MPACSEFFILKQNISYYLQRVNPIMLEHFELAKFSFDFVACANGHLPEFKGSILRGGFGHIFKGIVCLNEQGNCRSCEDRHSCAYLYIFETPVIQPGDKFSRYSDVPRPFVVDPCNAKKRTFVEGDPLQFGLVLVGKAIEYLPYFIFCFDELGRKGMGTERVRFNLKRVCGFDFGRGQWLPVYDPESRTLSDNLPIISADRLPFNCEDTLRLEFLTPTRIKYRENYITNMEFHIMIRNLLRRITMLMLFHCGSELDIDANELVSLAKMVDVREWDLRWHDFQRYSTRQNAPMELGGFVGSVAYKGDFEEFMPFIALGEQIHIGKNTTFGLGKYTIL